MQFLTWFKGQLEPLLDAYFAEKIKEAADIHPEVVVLAEEVRRFNQTGGKRVRPAFAYAAYTACGGRAHDAILYATAALELLQAFALIHDDIIDESPLRRGKPSTHVTFEEFHRKRKFAGDSKKFGLSAAILAGDLALTYADELLDTAPFPAERIRRAKSYYNTMKKQVILGQHLDLTTSVKEGASEKDILKILEYKTAKYTVERPLHIGAALAGAEEDLFTTFSAYGVPLGQAFQIQDDILGTFGSKEQIGKPTDSDIKEGKKTLLIIKAYEWANKGGIEILDAVLGNRKASEKMIEDARRTIRASGALEYSQNLANRLIKQAKEAIYEERLAAEGKAYLLQAADYLLSRQL
ncbi:MAG: hypothetical protein A2Z24_00670 [Candidatus Woykebacteria bacterium RBG_16_44_10]|uniref:Polyprenyl synthetase n=1 Tax=Candidatus Woykebacteria bacterium RBG_16_44_10 TaxID=1802597 RepID=A0A1G1WCY6_9BACT|nr:MAG: hypothetical protein A2Z24_00670 [Candidatus Woykebacteria bacterium RBG_16_44_10]